MDTHSTPLSRRTVLTTAGATALIALTTTAAAASSGSASSASAAGRFPETVGLPDGIRPEGITSGPGTRYYAGSLADGRIVAGDLRYSTVRVLLPGAEGRSIRGLYWDRRSNLVWAAGGVGAEGHVWAINGANGNVVLDVVVPGAVFLNDVVARGNGVWVTDSRVDRLTVIGIGDSGRPLANPIKFLALGGDWPAGDGTSINANGIRRLNDGSLVLNNSRVGGLWQVNYRTGAATEIPVSGGPGIIAGDGLELAGDVLYNVRGSGDNQVAAVRLSSSGGSWSATWITALTDETLDVPTTATKVGRYLWAVNARFGTVPDPTTATYWITRIDAV